MVKVLVIAAFVLTSLFAKVNYKEELTTTIKGLIGERTYNANKAYIKMLFSPTKRYFRHNHPNNVLIVKTLQENGLLKLFFNKPKELQLRFIANTSPTLFIKVLGDSLRSMGYYRYVTRSSSFDTSEFEWNISLVSEYAIDPSMFEKELAKRGAYIVSIARETPFKWEYKINMDNAHLKTVPLSREIKKLKRSLAPYWGNVAYRKKLIIQSGGRNSWHPYIAFYDRYLHLIKLVQSKKKTKYLALNVPKGSKYVKIADIYTMKNLKDGLEVVAK